MHTIAETSFSFPGQTGVYHGKVRDVYDIGDKLVMVASARISAFDHILHNAIPYKGQVLNQTANYFLNATRDIVPNWLVASPDPNVSVGLRCAPIKIEMVIRGYLAGHAWREYSAGKRLLCGEPMPDGMTESERFPKPIITPATKADEGHDEDISKEEILKQGILSKEIYEQLETYTHQLFARGTEMAAKQGLILVDTKYEFGMYEGKVYLIDEIHTPDSSRYYYKEGYAERLVNGEKQKQLSKEFVREWLMAHNFQGKEGQIMPEMPMHFVQEVSDRYITLYETITGQQFEKGDNVNPQDRILKNVENWLLNN